MTLSNADKAFIEKRERYTRFWPVAGTSMLLVVLAYSAWLWFRMPQLINPWWVMESIKAGTLTDSMTGVMAMMLPVVMLVFLVFAFAVILMWFIPFRNEKRLIRMVRELESD